MSPLVNVDWITIVYSLPIRRRKRRLLGACDRDLHLSNLYTFTDEFDRAQLEIAKKYHLPLFLHSRNCREDLKALLTEANMHINGGEAVGGRGGVAHSFTGTTEEMEELVRLVYAWIRNNPP